MLQLTLQPTGDLALVLDDGRVVTTRPSLIVPMAKTILQAQACHETTIGLAGAPTHAQVAEWTRDWLSRGNAIRHSNTIELSPDEEDF